MYPSRYNHEPKATAEIWEGGRRRKDEKVRRDHEASRMMEGGEKEQGCTVEYRILRRGILAFMKDMLEMMVVEDFLRLTHVNPNVARFGPESLKFGTTRPRPCSSTRLLDPFLPSSSTALTLDEMSS